MNKQTSERIESVVGYILAAVILIFLSIGSVAMCYAIKQFRLQIDQIERPQRVEVYQEINPIEPTDERVEFVDDAEPAQGEEFIDNA